MNKNKKGFTLVELLAVLILLIVVVVIAILNLMPTFDKGKMKSFIDEAFVMSEGSLNKYADDRLTKNFTADVFRSGNQSKRCYSIKSLIGRYVNKSNDDYHGSVEVCTAADCSYKTKLWLSDGEMYLNGVIVDDELSIDDIAEAATSEYFDSCGVSVFDTNEVWYFDYIGYEQTFIVPADGNYSIRAWGAQGGNRGGKGGYSYAEVELKQGEVLFINVGGAGGPKTYNPYSIVEGGYNGGGKANYNSGGGGGATHVALKSGYISTLNQKDILVVAGGGGGGWDAGNNGRNGGGNCDSSNTACYGTGTYGRVEGVGAGGGIYTTNGVDPSYIQNDGGRTVIGTPSGCSTCGGAGFIGNERNTNGVMYVVSGSNNNGVTTKTISTNRYSADPISGFGKLGNGFAMISYSDFQADVPEFAYTGGEQTYVVPETGKYKLEVWGAQGGGSSTGGYAFGEIELEKDDVLYINIGGQGTTGTFSSGARTGGYNGGGNGGKASSDWGGGPSGGGATHIATVSGLLSQLSENVDSVLIVAGGGGGDYGGLGVDRPAGGSGGGYKGANGYAPTATGGTQTSGYQFGQGATGKNGYYGSGGCGGGFYGGNTSLDPDSANTGGSGGSGYIGNSRLSNKGMYCNGCPESNAVDTKTTSVSCNSSEPRSGCGKTGDGYAKISRVYE